MARAVAHEDSEDRTLDRYLLVVMHNAKTGASNNYIPNALELEEVVSVEHLHLGLVRTQPETMQSHEWLILYHLRTTDLEGFRTKVATIRSIDPAAVLSEHECSVRYFLQVGDRVVAGS